MQHRALGHVTHEPWRRVSTAWQGACVQQGRISFQPCWKAPYLVFFHAAVAPYLMVGQKWMRACCTRRPHSECDAGRDGNTPHCTAFEEKPRSAPSSSGGGHVAPWRPACKRCKRCKPRQHSAQREPATRATLLSDLRARRAYLLFWNTADAYFFAGRRTVIRPCCTYLVVLQPTWVVAVDNVSASVAKS